MVKHHDFICHLAIVQYVTVTVLFGEQREV